jgi:hypothetical protein
MVRKTYILLSLMLLGIIHSGCERESNLRHPVPYVPVNLEINLRLISNQPLQQQGYQYYGGGVRGIVVINQGGIYTAFERNCPYQPQDSCATVSMHSSTLYLEDANCCQSTFDKTGNPTSGPAKFGLLQYTTSVDGDYLYVYN